MLIAALAVALSMPMQQSSALVSSADDDQHSASPFLLSSDHISTGATADAAATGATADATATEPISNNFDGAATGSCQWHSPKKILFLHTGKTAGSTLHASNELLSNLHINWTYVHDRSGHVDTADIIRAMEADYDLYIIPTREPLSRLVSAFNWMHLDGGGRWNFATVPAYDNATVASILADPLTSPHWSPRWSPDANVTYEHDFLAALSTCFPQLPGGVNAFAEALELDSRCGQIARRSLQATSGTGHLSKGFDFYLNMLIDSGANTLLDRIRNGGSAKHVFHVSEENFDDDAAALWQWLCVADPPTAEELIDDHPLSAYSNRSLLRHSDTSLTEAGEAALNRVLAPDYLALEVIRALTENKLSDPVTGLANDAAHQRRRA